MSAPAHLAGGTPTLRFRGETYPVLLPSIRDARLHLAAVIVSLQVLGQVSFGFRLSIAQIAVDRNPLSVDPLFELAAIQQARGQTPEAKVALQRATEVQPANAEVWRRLGRFRLDVLAEPRTALKDFQIAYYLDPQNPESWADLVLATRAVTADGG